MHVNVCTSDVVGAQDSPLKLQFLNSQAMAESRFLTTLADITVSAISYAKHRVLTPVFTVGLDNSFRS